MIKWTRSLGKYTLVDCIKNGFCLKRDICLLSRYMKSTVNQTDVKTVWDFRFSQSWVWRWLSSGMLHCYSVKRSPSASEVLTVSIIRAMRMPCMRNCFEIQQPTGQGRILERPIGKRVKTRQEQGSQMVKGQTTAWPKSGRQDEAERWSSADTDWCFHGASCLQHQVITGVVNTSACIHRKNQQVCIAYQSKSGSPVIRNQLTF
jgi:hypothetical protein